MKWADEIESKEELGKTTRSKRAANQVGWLNSVPGEWGRTTNHFKSLWRELFPSLGYWFRQFWKIGNWKRKR